MKTELHRLPDSELEVMQAVWRCEAPATRKEIEKNLNREPPMAATTLLTLLSRLAERGFLCIQKEGRGSVYTPLVEKHDYLSSQSETFIRKLCGGSMTAFASALCSSGLSKEEIEELRQLLKENRL